MVGRILDVKSLHESFYILVSFNPDLMKLSDVVHSFVSITQCAHHSNNSDQRLEVILNVSLTDTQFETLIAIFKKKAKKLHQIKKSTENAVTQSDTKRHGDTK